VFTVSLSYAQASIRNASWGQYILCKGRALFFATPYCAQADALEFLHWCSGVVVQISKVHAAWIEVVRDSFDGSVRGVGDDRIRCNAVE
jgi:hypothetical protein